MKVSNIIKVQILILLLFSEIVEAKEDQIGKNLENVSQTTSGKIDVITPSPNAKHNAIFNTSSSTHPPRMTKQKPVTMKATVPPTSPTSTAKATPTTPEPTTPTPTTPTTTTTPTSPSTTTSTTSTTQTTTTPTTPTTTTSTPIPTTTITTEAPEVSTTSSVSSSVSDVSTIDMGSSTPESSTTDFNSTTEPYSTQTSSTSTSKPEPPSTEKHRKTTTTTAIPKKTEETSTRSAQRHFEEVTATCDKNPKDVKCPKLCPKLKPLEEEEYGIGTLVMFGLAGVIFIIDFIGIFLIIKKLRKGKKVRAPPVSTVSVVKMVPVVNNPKATIVTSCEKSGDEDDEKEERNTSDDMNPLQQQKRKQVSKSMRDRFHAMTRRHRLQEASDKRDDKFKKMGKMFFPLEVDEGAFEQHGKFPEGDIVLDKITYNPSKNERFYIGSEIDDVEYAPSEVSSTDSDEENLAPAPIPPAAAAATGSGSTTAPPATVSQPPIAVLTPTAPIASTAPVPNSTSNPADNKKSKNPADPSMKKTQSARSSTKK